MFGERGVFGVRAVFGILRDDIGIGFVLYLVSEAMLTLQHSTMIIIVAECLQV